MGTTVVKRESGGLSFLGRGREIRKCGGRGHERSCEGEKGGLCAEGTGSRSVFFFLAK